MPGLLPLRESQSMAAGVVVGLEDGPLGHILAARLEEAFPGLVRRALAESCEPGDTLIVTPSDLDPRESAELVGRRVNVVVLTPVNRRDEERDYARAGVAAYVVMALDDAASLIQAVSQARADYFAAPWRKSHSAAASQRLSPLLSFSKSHHSAPQR